MQPERKGRADGRRSESRPPGRARVRMRFLGAYAPSAFAAAARFAGFTKSVIP